MFGQPSRRCLPSLLAVLGLAVVCGKSAWAVPVFQVTGFEQNGNSNTILHKANSGSSGTLLGRITFGNPTLNDTYTPSTGQLSVSGATVQDLSGNVIGSVNLSSSNLVGPPTGSLFGSIQFDFFNLAAGDFLDHLDDEYAPDANGVFSVVMNFLNQNYSGPFNSFTAPDGTNDGSVALWGADGTVNHGNITGSHLGIDLVFTFGAMPIHTPEPTSLLTWGIVGLIAAGAAARRRRK